MKKIQKALSGLLAGLMLFTSVPVSALPSVVSDSSTESIINTEEENSPEIETNAISTNETAKTNSNNTKENEITESQTEETPIIEDNPTVFLDGEEEPEEENWELGLVFYDSTVENGTKPLTEINWDATSTVETRIIKNQINYKSQSRTKDYAPGELQILIPDLLSPYSNGIGNVEIGADVYSSTTKNYEWSYSSLTQDGVKYYKFVNNNTIKTTDNFEGSIQISYRFNASKGINNASTTFKATLVNIAESNEVSFHFTGNKQPYTMEIYANKITSYDGLPSGDYIWVKYRVSASSDENKGVYCANKSSVYLKIDVPENCILLDIDTNAVSPDENGEYIVNNYEYNSYDSYLTYEFLGSYFYIGYPTAEYKDKTLNTNVELYGFYCDKGTTGITDSNPKTIEKLTDISKEIKINDFVFIYTGELYSIKKSNFNEQLNYDLVKHTGSVGYFAIDLKEVYTNKPMTIRIGDDILLYEDSDGNIQKLSNDEYWLREIHIPDFKNGNGIKIEKGKYDMALYVKYADSDNYVKYNDTFKYQGSQNIYFNKDDHIVEWYLEIYDLNQSLYTDLMNNSLVAFYTFNKKDVELNDKIHNFAYVQIYIDGVLQNEPDLDSYATFVTKDEIAAYDQKTYGTYMQRDSDYLSIEEYSTHIFPRESINNMKKDTGNEIFTTTAQITMYYAGQNYKEPDFKGYTLYDLLPAGTELNGDITTNISSSLYSDIIYNNKNFETKEEYLDFIKNHLTVTITENYRNSGRTMVEIKTDFSDCPLDLSDLANIKNTTTTSFVGMEYYNIPIKVSYESYLEYGSVYENRVYVTLTHGDYLKGGTYIGYNEDNGYYDEIVKDIDNDGNTTEILSTDSATTSILDSVSTHQSATVYCQTDKNNYTTDIANSSCDTQYTYKLKSVSGTTDITNLVMYTSIEEAQQGKSRWKGTFLGVDTSYAEKKGYKVKVWYSENETVGTLAEDTSWKEYSDSVDKTKVKSLAFQYLNADETSAILPSNSLTYVLINMKSPADENITTLARMDFNTQWNAIDEYGKPVDFITGINSNIVKVALPNSVLNDSIPSIELDITKEIQGTNEDFENLKLDPNAEYNFQIILEKQEANEDGSHDIVHGLLSNKKGLIIKGLTVGSWLISEADDNYFDFIDIVSTMAPDIEVKGVTFEKTDVGYLLTITEDLDPDIDTIYSLKVINKIEPESYYEDKDEKVNLFKETLNQD